MLSALNGDEAKMRAICETMDIPGYSKNTDATGLFVLLKDMAAQNTNPSSKYGGRTYQDRFIEVASLKTEELDTTRNVIRAKREGIIRVRPGFFFLKDDKIDGDFNDLKLIEYFKDPKNQNKYSTLLELLEFDK